MVRALADKNYVEDVIFWNDFVFKFVEFNEDKSEKMFSSEEARKMWDTLIYLKLKCPTIDISVPL